MRTSERYVAFKAYSERVSDKAAQRRALESLDSIVESFGRRTELTEPETQDWVAVLGIGSVAKKVEGLLWRADVVVADITGANPNVLFEIGFAKARGIPVLLLALQGAKAPADLGDAEICRYPPSDETPNQWERFATELKTRLSELQKQQTLGAIFLRREAGELNKKIARIQNPEDAAAEPMLRILSGWMNRISDELGSNLPRSFHVDADYYQACFARFTEAERRGALAAADLSRGSERFWVSGELTTNMQVGTRAFLVQGLDFFDATKLAVIFDRLKEEAKRYTVLVGRADGEGMPTHVFNVDKGPAKKEIDRAVSPGHDVLVIGEQLVAGYVRSRGHDQLRVVVDETLNQEARVYFEELKRHTIEFNTGWRSPAEMRAALLRTLKIGAWSPDWTSSRRSPDYYANYDLHIRCWIPEYVDLIHQTGNAVIDAFYSPGRNRRALKLLEIGFGTGSLTRYLSSELGRSLPSISRGGTAHEYFGVDRSSDMLNRAKRVASQARELNIQLMRGEAFAGLPPGLREARFDIICGSLVLNHFVGADVAELEDRLREHLRGAKERLAEGGCAVFSDSIAHDQIDIEVRRNEWREKLTHGIGLAREAADAFLEGNQAMLSITESVVERAAKAAGFTRVRFLSVASPFQVVVLD